MTKERNQSNFLTRLETLRELLRFLWKRKLWWLIPMIVVLTMFVLVLVSAQGSAIIHFLYPLF